MAARAKAKGKAPKKPKPKGSSNPGERRWLRPFGLRASFEAHKAEKVGEERLLAYVAFACFAAFLIGLPAAVDLGRSMDQPGGAVALVAGRFVAMLIFGPLFLYGLAGVCHWICSKVFGGAGSYFDARLALFWSLVLGVPLIAAQAVLSYVADEVGMPGLLVWSGLAVFVIWLWIWSSLIAIAEGFQRLATFCLAFLVVFCVAGLILLGAQ